MGPLVPDIIGNEFDLVIALILGIGFGFILEQAGFSTTKKLVGLFYGYDFTVLRVFFTAGVTAMIGILVLGHFNLLDLSLLFINPTFLYAALVGGAIMGVGFILGGFCPGTSVCAAAVGKIDAMAFLLGSFLGIVLFIEGFSIWGDLFIMESMGDLKMNEVFGLSPELFAVIITLVAIGAFVMVTRIEDKVNGRKSSYSTKKMATTFSYAIAPVLIIGILSFTSNHTESVKSDVAEKLSNNTKINEIAADEFSSKLIESYYDFNVIDIRSKEEYKKSHLPLAINIPVDSLMNKEWGNYFTQNHKANVFYGDDFNNVKRAYFTAENIGKAENYGLIESHNEFKALYYNLEQPDKDKRKELDVYKFRKKMGADLTKLEDAMMKFSQPVKKKATKAKGGCA
ncbi:MAG: YeeE/YedE family protein [Melioribacteraceae bacterium]|nr:YeeE/YedE family protein [Melioribacteraceae bacterium]